MTVVWTRVDQKLIHGQVAVAWVPRLKIDAIVVSDRDTADDPWTQKVMRLGLPPEVEVTCFTSPERLAQVLAGEELACRRVLVLFKSLGDFLAAAATGLRPAAVNLGNQAARPTGRNVRLADCFYADLKDLEDLARLARSGLEVIVQAVPAAKAVKWRPGPK